MEHLIRFLRLNALKSGDKSGSYRRLEEAIYKRFVEACGPQDNSPGQNDTER